MQVSAGAAGLLPPDIDFPPYEPFPSEPPPAIPVPLKGQPQEESMPPPPPPVSPPPSGTGVRLPGIAALGTLEQ